MADGTDDYPVYCAFAFLLLAGYLARTVFLSLRLPAVVGVILVGMLFSSFMQDGVLWARDVLQESAFFLVLLKAGLEISIQDLNAATIIMAWVPVSLELIGLTAYAVLVFDYTVIEALTLGNILCCLGEGLVIPKMNEFGRAFPRHPLPRQVFTCAPLEACYALTMFGILSGFAAPSHEVHVPYGRLIVANVVRIILTLVVGSMLGYVCGKAIPKRTRLTIWERQVFTGSAVESFLIVLGVGLGAFGLGMDRNSGQALLPMGFAPGSVFTPELLVIVFGTSLAAAMPDEEVHEVEEVMGGVWIFGQIILFSMLGSKTSFGAFREFPKVLPLMLVGFVFRFVGVLGSVMATRRWRVCSTPGCLECRVANKRSAWPDTIFCFLSALPRATLQGALASVPLRKRFFFADGAQGAAACEFMSIAGRIYIPFLAIFGSLLLDLLGPHLLRYSGEVAQRHEEAEQLDRDLWTDGWKTRIRTMSHRSLSFRSAASAAPGNIARVDPLNAFEAYVGTRSFPVPPRRDSDDRPLSAIGISPASSYRQPSLPGVAITSASFPATSSSRAPASSSRATASFAPASSSTA